MSRGFCVFLSKWLLVAVIGLFVGFSTVMAADAGTPGYTLLDRPWPVKNPDKIEVLAFFGYTCGYCYTLAVTQLHEWEVPADVDFQEVPLNFSNTNHLSRAYHAAESLGINKQYHPVLFEAFLKHRKQFRSKEELAALALPFGVTEAQFIAAYDSFAVKVAMNRSDTHAKNYQISSVPLIIVNGKYKTSPSEAGGYAETLQVIEFLIERERALLDAVIANTNP